MRTLVVAVLLWLLFVSSAVAAITVDAVSTVNDNNPITLTRSHTTSGADRLMLVGVSIWNDDYEVVDTVTYGGTALTRVGTHQRDNDSRVEIWSLVAPATGTANVVVTFDQRVDDGAGFGVITLNGVDQTTPYGAMAANDGDSGTASLTVSSAGDELVFAVGAAEQQDGNPTAGGGIAERWNYKWSGNNRLVGVGGTRSGAASVNMSWSLDDSDDWAMAGLSIKPVSGGGGSGSGTCAEVFPSVLQNSDPGGDIVFGWNGQVFDDPDNALETTNAISFNQWGAATCGTVDCTETGTNSTPATTETFKTSSGSTDVNTGWNGSFVLGSDGNDNYDRIRTGGSSVIQDNGAYPVYYIDRLDLAYNDQLILQGGSDYWIRDLNFSSSSHEITVQGSGTARLFVQENVTVAWAAELNSAGPAEKLLIVAYGNYSHNTGSTPSQFLLYSAGNVTLANATRITGAIAAAGRIRLNSSSAQVTYAPSAVTAVDHRGVCGSGGGGSTPYAWFQLDDSPGSWNGTGGEIVDQIGNVSGAFALATGSGVDSTTARVCNGVDVPSNTSDADQYGIDSSIDIDSDLGAVGTISFWYNSNAAWNGGGNRMLVDASTTADDKYFFLALMNSGSLRFRLEDSSDGDFQLDTATQGFAADTWHHIAISWDLPNDSMEVFVDGSSAGTNNGNTTGSLGQLGTIYFGDNRSSYHPSGTANSANGIIDEIRIFTTVQTAAEINADITDDVTSSRICPVSSVDHYAISHSGVAVTCEAETVTVTGHDASEAAVAPSASTTITLSTSIAVDGWALKSGNGTFSAPNQYTFDGTETAVEFWLTQTTATTAPHIDIDVSDGTANDLESPALEFRDTAFRFYADGSNNSIGPQIAGKPSSTDPGSQTLTLRAVQTNTDTGACEARITGQQAVPMAYECINPTTCKINNGVTVIDSVIGGAGNPLVGNPQGGPISYGDVDLTFDGTGKATWSMTYLDAGQLKLHAELVIPASGDDPEITLAGASNQFVVRPFAFALDYGGERAGMSVADRLNCKGDLSYAVDADGSVFAKSGNDFTLTMTAVAWQAADDSDNNGIPDAVNNDPPPDNIYDNCADLYDNPITGNFDVAEAGVTVSGTLAAPSGGVAGSISESAGGVDFNNGVGSKNLSWNEVGIVHLAATLDYLGSGEVVFGASYNVGRFTPDHFEISVLDDGTLADSCTVFTYTGQDFTYGPDIDELPGELVDYPTLLITAKNSGGATTQNYRGAFDKLSATDIVMPGSIADATEKGADGSTPLTLTWIPGTPDLTNNNDGTLTFTLGDDTFRYDRVSNAITDEFTGDIELTISSIKDGDNVEAVGTAYDFKLDAQHPSDPPGVAEDGIKVRYGRLALQNAYGSELLPLGMPLQAEYFTANGYATNTLDGCTALTTTNHLELSSDGSNWFSGDIARAVGSGTTLATLSASPLANGDAGLSFSAPGAENSGSVEVRTAIGTDYPWLLYDWDADGTDDEATGRITFGIFKGNNRLIYMRESVQ